MIQGKWFAPGEELSPEVLSVRNKVFGITEPSVDSEGWNALVYSDDTPAASGRIWWEDGSYRIGKICVLPHLRGNHLGDLVLRLLLFKAQSHAAREIRLVCPETTEVFFSRLGFRSVAQESGMLEMLLPGDEIELDSCASCKKENCPNRK